MKSAQSGVYPEAVKRIADSMTHLPAQELAIIERMISGLAGGAPSAEVTNCAAAPEEEEVEVPTVPKVKRVVVASAISGDNDDDEEGAADFDLSAAGVEDLGFLGDDF